MPVPTAAAASAARGSSTRNTPPVPQRGCLGCELSTQQLQGVQAPAGSEAGAWAASQASRRARLLAVGMPLPLLPRMGAGCSLSCAACAGGCIATAAGLICCSSCCWSSGGSRRGCPSGPRCCRCRRGRGTQSGTGAGPACACTNCRAWFCARTMRRRHSTRASMSSRPAATCASGWGWLQRE